MESVDFAPRMLSRGDMVKDYEIIAPLRSGGMALLYLARRRGAGGINRLVVLKLVHPDLVENERMTALFLAEARVCAQIAHPNLVHVEEIGELDGRYFLAMEYVHGVSLSELLSVLNERRLRMNTKLCVWIVAQIAEALHAVHEARGDNDKPLRIVHSDVSPQNVLIGHTGHVKLIDFGIAKSRHDSTGPYSALLGKLGYMAPEQLSLAAIDRRTDVYALGVMLWEMLAARSLFRCQRIDDERDWATREDPPLVSTFSPVSEALDRVVRRTIDANPGARYSSALAFRAALLRAQPDALQIDPPRLASFMYPLIGEELKRQRESWPLDVSAPLELEAAAPGASDPSTKVPREHSDEYDTTTRVRDAQWLFDDPTGVDDRAIVCPVDDEANTEVTVPQSPHARRASIPQQSDSLDSSRPPAPIQVMALHEPWPPSPAKPPAITLRPAQPVFPSIEAQVVTVASAASSAPPGRGSRGAGLLSLGVLCLALGCVIGVLVRREPVGTVRRLPTSAAFREPAAQLTAGEPELRPRRPNAVKRGLVLASRDAGIPQARAKRTYKQATRPKVAKRAKR
jgi:serine/threonine protein kinase